jgi:hypothetical protein
MDGAKLDGARSLFTAFSVCSGIGYYKSQFGASYDEGMRLPLNVCDLTGTPRIRLDVDADACSSSSRRASICESLVRIIYLTSTLQQSHLPTSLHRPVSSV